MKNQSLITSALVAAGLVSAASAFGAATTVYLTGSTAFRATVFTAATTGGDIFDASPAPTILSPSPNNTSGANNIVYHGFINGTEYILNCAFTGSEAGIAAVAGVTVPNVTVPANYNGDGTPASPTLYNLPGAPVGFLSAPGYTTVGPNQQPDLSMADTSQAVSLTQTATLTDYGVVGIVPFVWAKNKNTAPDASWSDLSNVSNAELLFELGGAKPASFFTGKSTDTDLVYVVGRNKGSGTHQNAMLASGFYPGTPVQYQIDSKYNSSGVLTLTPAATFVNGDVRATPGGDGFESGKFVAQTMQTDGKNATKILIGYIGISDFTGNPGGVALTVDGVAESDGAVANGAYSFWGHEHLLGQATPSSDANNVANGIGGVGGIINGLNAVLSSTLVDNAQSGGLNVSVMTVDKPGGDFGYPSP